MGGQGPLGPAMFHYHLKKFFLILNFKKIFIYLFRLHWVLVASCLRDLVPQPGIQPGPPALGAQSLTHWTTREVPSLPFLR